MGMLTVWNALDADTTTVHTNFFQQGIQEHGEEVVRSAFSFKGGIFQINPNQVPICPSCRLIIWGGVYHYLYYGRDGGPSMPAARQLLL